MVCTLTRGSIVVALLFLASFAPASGEEPSQPSVATETTRPTLGHFVGDSAPVDAAIATALAGPLKSSGLQFTEEPLENIIDFLQAEYKIPILLDLPALEDAGLTSDMPVTARLKNMSLRSALRLLLKPTDLTYVLRNEVLLITTRDSAQSKLVTGIYDVRDLRQAVRPPNQPAGASAWADYDELIGVLTECVSPETWKENGGGRGNVRRIHPGILVVYQSPEVHSEIAELFDAVRQTLRHPIPSLSRVDSAQIEQTRAAGQHQAATEARPRQGEFGDRGGEPSPSAADGNPFD
jgi:hypothetical protein